MGEAPQMPRIYLLNSVNINSHKEESCFFRHRWSSPAALCFKMILSWMAEKLLGQEASREDVAACGDSLCVTAHHLCIPRSFSSTVRASDSRASLLLLLCLSLFLHGFISPHSSVLISLVHLLCFPSWQRRGCNENARSLLSLHAVVAVCLVLLCVCCSVVS